MSREEQIGSIDPEKPSVQHPGLIDDLAIDDFDDPNLDIMAFVTDDDSPYPEVRSAVANTDDPTMPASTFRAWVVGLIWAIIISGVNQFFYLRYPSVGIGTGVPLLFSFLVCKLWARYLPNVSLLGISLNPGPFTIKEHVLVTIMASVGPYSAYATDVIAVQRLFYNQHPSFTYQWLLLMSTQLLGFSIGGICKRFLVTPPSTIWPQNLAYAALFNTLHSQETSGSHSHGGISRQRFFVYVFVGYIFYNFFPSYLFTALSSFSWVCWIAPNNAKINQLFGVTHGMAMGIITFDWGQITAYAGSPLSTPWWVAANSGFTIIIFYWFITVILYYNNVWYSAYLPLVSWQSFDNTGKKYNVSKIINPDSSFNSEAYRTYSPLFLPVSFAVFYGLSFASIAATLTHTLLYYRKRIWCQARRSLSEQPDIHARLMSMYKEVPDWWYLTIFVTMFVVGVAVIEVWGTQLPVWSFMLALVIPFIFTVPIGVIQAMTNEQVGLNVITELIIGYILPGRPIAMMLFKTWGYITMSQALKFTSGFKLGHYMKIPHRPMFLCQIVATVVSGTVQLAVQAWMFSNIKDLCSPDQPGGLTCPNSIAFGTTSIIWGIIGPQRIFSNGQLYHGLMLFFVVGIIAPLFQWVIHKKFKMNFLKYVNFPVIFSSTAYMPPATPINYVPAVVVCFVFNYRIRRRHFGWWSKYNYVLSGALDAGYAVGAVIIFFVLQYPKNGTIGLNTIQKWWGNVVYTNTADFNGVPYKTVPQGGTFGPSSW